MKTKHVFWGFFLVTIGFLFLAQNVFSFSLAVNNLHNYWPLVLVLIGLNVMLKDQKAKLILSAVSAVTLGFILFSLVNNGLCGIKRKFERKHFEVQNYSAPFDKKIKSVELKFEGGAVDLKLNSNTNDLIFVDGSKLNDRFYIDNSIDDSIAEINVKMNDMNINFSDSSFISDLNISLNKKPEYEMRFEFGAASINLNMEELKVNKLSMEMGAASLYIKLGEPKEDECELNIESGASSIKIDIPKSVGSKIYTDSPLSPTHFSGFKEIQDDEYITENFEQSTKKIRINFKGGVSSITVNRY